MKKLKINILGIVRMIFLSIINFTAEININKEAIIDTTIFKVSFFISRLPAINTITANKIRFSISNVFIFFNQTALQE